MTAPQEKADEVSVPRQREEPRGPGIELSQEDYVALADLRHGQRRFLHWSAERAADVGLTATQHQLLLGLRAWPQETGSTIGDIAEFLFIRHNSAVELVDRAEKAGLVVRRPTAQPGGQVFVTITPDGRERLRALTESHLQELVELAPTMSALWGAVATVAQERERERDRPLRDPADADARA